MVHTSSDLSVLVAGKLLTQHGGNSHSKQELKVELFLSVIVISVIFVAFHSIHVTVGLFSDFANVSKDTTNTLMLQYCACEKLLLFVLPLQFSAPRFSPSLY